MSKVIDELIVVLGLDASQFDEARKKTVERWVDARKRIETETNKNNAAFNSMVTTLGKVAAAYISVAAISKFATEIVKSEAAVGRYSKSLGISTEELSAWRGVAQTAGGSAQGITSTIANLTTEFIRFTQTGQSSVIPYFRALGVDLVDPTTGRFKDMTEVLLETADAIKGLSPVQARGALLGAGFTEDDINLLLQGRSKLESLLERQRGFGVISPEDAEAAKQLQESWAQLEQSFLSAGRNIVNATIPALTSLVKLLTNVGDVLAALFNKDQTVAESMRLGARVSGQASSSETIDKVVETLKTKEGYRATPYKDSLGYWTTGYGHLIDSRIVGGPGPYASKWNTPLSQNDATAILRADVLKTYSQLLNAQDVFFRGKKSGPVSADRIFAQQTPEVQQSLINLAFQLGVPGLLKFKSLWGSLADKDMEGAQRAILNSKLAAQTPTRAQDAARAFAGGLRAAAVAAPVVHPIPRGSSSSITSTTNTNSNDVRVGEVNIHTKATDAKGIAAEIKSAMRDLFMSPNYGAN